MVSDPQQVRSLANWIISEHSADLKMAVGIVVMLLCIALIGAVDPTVVR
jgi:hypothetical protein